VTWFTVNLVLVHLEMVLVSVQDRCTDCAKRTIGSGIILDEMMELLGDEAMWMLVSVRLEIVLMLTQHRCTVCAECTICSKIFLHASDGTPCRILFWSI
jgi:hypothetical protein